MSNKLVTLLFSCTTLALTACSSAPTQVKAKLPLVAKSSVNQSADNMKIANIIPINDFIPSQPVKVGTELFVVGNEYLSALGQRCFNLKQKINNQSAYASSSQSVCLNSNTWYFYPVLVNSDS
jgi:hypothetical protein